MLVRQKDKGIRGALISFQDDNDIVSLRNRLVHKILTPTGSREDRNANGVGTSSSATTAGFQQYSHGASRERQTPFSMNPKTYQDRYMPIIIDLEAK